MTDPFLKEPFTTLVLFGMQQHTFAKRVYDSVQNAKRYGLPGTRSAL
jgi:hypothetical protein